MKVGIPKEIKNNENRVGMTPAGVAAMTARGHEVFVQHTAGDGSGFSDDEYVGAGAKIVPTIEDVYRECVFAYAFYGLFYGLQKRGTLALPVRKGFAKMF